MSTKDTPQKSTVLRFQRFFRGGGGGEDEIADAVLEEMSQAPDASHLEYCNGYVVGQSEQYTPIGENINFRVTRLLKSNDGQPEEIHFELQSNTLSIQEIRRYVNEITDKHRNQKGNKLGNRVYYFDEISQPLPPHMNGGYVYKNAPQNLKFSMTPFYSNKTLDALFGPEIKTVMDRLEWFLCHPNWYASKGLPYTFGLLLHGDPGCGKTSLIKSIAKRTGRHIFNVKFHDFLTQTQVHNLFFTDKVFVEEDHHRPPESFLVPQSKRLYVLEDIDCMNDMVLERKTTSFQKQSDTCTADGLLQKKKERRLLPATGEEGSGEKLSLSFLLNLMDGVLEIPGRIMIMTTNHPSLLDKALIRPGRIDMILGFKKATRQTVIQMYRHFYDIQDDGKDDIESHLSSVQDFRLSPAEVNQIFFRHLRSPEGALKELSSLGDYAPEHR